MGWTLRILIISSLSALLIPPLARASELGCLGEAPLVESAWHPSETASCGEASLPREWRLPISSDRPDVITKAKTEIQFEKPSPEANWIAHVHFSFKDPLPLGIPFSFQKLKVLWRATAHENWSETLTDWSEECAFAGRGMFPGEGFSVSVELPDTRSLCTIPEAGLLLWGGRY